MDKEKTKKTAVIVITAIVVLVLLLQALLFFVLSLNVIWLAILAIIDVILIVPMIYYAKQRLDEIEEGMDNDVDNY